MESYKRSSAVCMGVDTGLTVNDRPLYFRRYAIHHRICCAAFKRSRLSMPVDSRFTFVHGPVNAGMDGAGFGEVDTISSLRVEHAHFLRSHIANLQRLLFV